MAAKSALDGIRYIFQIPLSWFKKVDEWLFGVHPGYLMSFGQDPETAPTIGVDQALFEQEVARIAGGSGGSGASGTVTVVTNIQWTGTYLQKKTRTITYTNGAVTAIGNESSWTTWETPVSYNP